jgi:hypothetical protein
VQGEHEVGEGRDQQQALGGAQPGTVVELDRVALEASWIEQLQPNPEQMNQQEEDQAQVRLALMRAFYFFRGCSPPWIWGTS